MHPPDLALPMKPANRDLTRRYLRALKSCLNGSVEDHPVAVAELGSNAASAGHSLHSLALAHSDALLELKLLGASTPRAKRLLDEAGRFFERTTASFECSRLGCPHVHEPVAAPGPADSRRIARNLIQCLEQDRKRISRDLHDIVAQTLVAVGQELDSLELASGDPVHFLKQLAHTSQRVAESLGIVHKFAGDLRPAALEHLGLVSSISQALSDFTHLTGIRCLSPTLDPCIHLDSEQQIAFYRVAQEALVNIGKHSHATLVVMTLKDLGSRARLRIFDNGCGFPTDRKNLPVAPRRLGLLGMRERIEALDGRISIDSSPAARRTVITAEFSRALRPGRF